MTPPHVVVLATLAELGGAERSLVELLHGVRGALRASLVLPDDGPPPPRRPRWECGSTCCAGRAGCGARERARGRARRLDRRAAPARCWRSARLRTELAALAPDVVVTNGIKAHVLGALACGRGGPALVWYGREGSRDAVVARCSGSSAAGSGAVAISEYVAGELRPLLPAGAPIRVVYNIVDGERFRPGLAAPTDLGKVPGEVRFGVVGALTPLKGQDLFLRAAARVVRELPHARFVLVGGTPYRTEAGLGFAEALRREASALGLDGRVRFLGQRADAARVIASLDVLVQPNRGPEGLGRAVLEAMACGVAVVAVDRWGLSEIVRDGETGLATPHLDVDALATRMRRLGTDAALRARLGRAGRRWVTTHCSRDRLARAFVSAVDAALTPAARTVRHPAQGLVQVGR
jgi:glycosyltransferase involved in cell wall biosynthesis